MTSDVCAKLADIEAIRHLKARYFRTMDSKDWSGLADCFSQDLVADFRGGPGMYCEGRDNYMEQIAEILKDATTVHHGHMPEITLVDANNATGIWAMDDIVLMPGVELRGWGHYHESYRKEGDTWRIAKIRLSRLRLLMNGEAQDIQALNP